MFQPVRLNETTILASIVEGVQVTSIAPNSEKQQVRKNRK
jgi:hypothetical protein